MMKPMRESFLARVRIRWWTVTILSICAVIALYSILEVSSDDLIAEITTKVVLWITRIWFGIGILIGFVMRSLYIANADTEVWGMADIELTKRISRYEAEQEIRERDDEWRHIKRVSKKELADRVQQEALKKATDATERKSTG